MLSILYAIAVLLESGSVCPPKEHVRATEKSCGLPDFREILYRRQLTPSWRNNMDQSSEAPATNMYRRQLMCPSWRSYIESDEEIDWQEEQYLICMEYKHVIGCPTREFQIPEHCLSKEYLNLKIVFGFRCGPGKQSFIDHIDCIQSVDTYSNTEVCEQYHNIYLNQADRCFSSLNYPFVEFMEQIVNALHEIWKLTCPSGLQKTVVPCMKNTYERYCGAEAVKYLESELVFMRQEIEGFVKNLGIPELIQAFSCEHTSSLAFDSSQSHGTDTSSLRHIFSTFGNNMSERCISFMTEGKSKSRQTFGQCGPPEMFDIGRCLCETARKFALPEGKTLLEETDTDMVITLCSSYVDQFLKCSVHDVAVCPNGPLKHVRTMFSSLCSGLTSGARIPKCREVMLHIFTNPDNCRTGWMELMHMMIAVPQFIRKDEPDMMEKVRSSSRCLFESKSEYVKKYVQPLCGYQIAADLIDGVQKFLLIIEDFAQILK